MLDDVRSFFFLVVLSLFALFFLCVLLLWVWFLKINAEYGLVKDLVGDEARANGGGAAQNQGDQPSNSLELALTGISSNIAVNDIKDACLDNWVDLYWLFDAFFDGIKVRLIVLGYVAFFLIAFCLSKNSCH